jgi:transcriptional regulator with XRE-family HTH domain
MASIGENIAALRKKAGLTQEELSEKMCVTAQAVSKWENDLSCPDIEKIRSMAKLFSVTVDELLNGGKDVPVLKSDEPEKIAKRILHIQVNTGGDTRIHCRIPTAVFLKAAENGTLDKLIGEELEGGQLEMVLEIIKSGTVGSIVSVDQGDSHVEIAVEDYEG